MILYRPLIAFVAVTLIQIPTWGPVSIIEAIWTAIGAASLAVVLPNLRQSWLDYRASCRQSDPAIRALGFGYLRREAIRLGQAAAILGIGIVADTQASPAGANYITPLGIVITAALVLIGALVGIQSYFDLRQRHHVVALLRQTQTKGSSR